MKYDDVTFRRARDEIARISRVFAAIIPHTTCAAWLAPDTLAKLVDQQSTRGIVPVSYEHCERTIFRAPGDNIAFRVWHDWRHITHRAEFDRAGETEAFLAQCADAEALRHRGGTFADLQAVKHLLRCEILGQLDYHERTGEFPADQREFTAQWLNDNPL